MVDWTYHGWDTGRNKNREIDYDRVTEKYCWDNSSPVLREVKNYSSNLVFFNPLRRYYEVDYSQSLS